MVAVTRPSSRTAPPTLCRTSQPLQRLGVAIFTCRQIDNRSLTSESCKYLYDHPTSLIHFHPHPLTLTPTQSQMEWFKNIYEWLLSLFWSTELDITLLGLQNAGKTSLLKAICGSDFTPDSIPTVGFAMKRVKVGRVTLKCWDLGGQPRFRSMWERYCRGVNAVVFILDSADPSTFDTAKTELHSLLEKESMEGIPLLVLGNKNDIADAIPVDKVIQTLGLKEITDREVSCYSISVKEANNLSAVLKWLIANRKT
ncbi:uncharacterized protein YALI1_E14584g [Yarrowia lipolytica]|nr:hypothetical protein YALI1_E14584g [Yarrowia lipolytica]